MKKLLVLALSLMTGFSAFAGSQGEDNGFGLKFYAGLHGKKYGKPAFSYDGPGAKELEKEYDKEIEESPNASPALGFSIDNRWYVANPGQFGIAINARWFDFSYSRLKEKYTVEEWDKKAHKNVNVTYTGTSKYFDISMLGVGPIGTYYLSDEMAVDLYYNIMPNVFVTVEDAGDGSDSDATFAFGASHRVGAAYRYKVFQAGVELKLGKLKVQDWGQDDTPVVEGDDEFSELANQLANQVSSMLGDQKAVTNSFRIFIGFKF